MANIGGVRRPREDDVLECFFFPRVCYTSNPENVSEGELLQEISKLNQEINQFTEGYIWQRDSLIFRPKTRQMLLLDKVLSGSSVTEECQLLPHIYVRLRFDEDIGDEWFTVFLIYHLTKVFDGLIARVIDGDGEFLLIEAADHLPVWANADTCQDRTFIREGAVYIVQNIQKTFLERLEAISKWPELYRMPDSVQTTIWKKLSIYPEEIQRRKHKARAFLPEKAAAILNQEPGLIAAAVRSICHSDPLERKVCRAMKYFPPEQRIMVNVKVTKCLYAMATHCRYNGDPRTGWSLPPATNSKYNAYVLGVKIACGMELLIARANDDARRWKSKQKLTENNDSELKSREKAWEIYLSRLESNGYFKGLLEGSQERKELYRVAREYFLDNSNCCQPALTESYSGDSEAGRLLTAWQNAQSCDVQDEGSLSPADSDSWLNVTPAQLEAMLNQHWGPSEKKPEREVLSLREKVQAFLNQSSGIDGVQFPGEGMTDDTKVEPDESTRMEFDADVFDTTLRDILDLVVPGGDDEFEGSSEGSLGGSNEGNENELDKYMKLLDSQLEVEMLKGNDRVECRSEESVETSLRESIDNEAGGSGPTGNILGGPIRRLMHLQLQSPTTVPPDLQS
ncbi:protein ecdysoneless [Orussus abietinus]|uniref:protein ecdysoneless n=1 Tax=Orussus abietinus TaxID=222816 RepID=UPI000626EB5E|nr:protein ecdysoneless [Orussus abietinus]